jgi:hypothetical protein
MVVERLRNTQRPSGLTTNRARVASTVNTLPALQKGQVWRIGDSSLAVTSVGKTLAEYKRYTTQSRNISSTLTSKRDLEEYLRSSKAVLMSQ